MYNGKTLDSFLSRSTHLLSHEVDEICNCCELIFLKPGEYFQEINMPVGRMGFIESGIVKTYSIDHQGVDFIWYFNCPGHFIFDPEGLLRRKLSSTAIQAVTLCKVLSLKIQVLDLLKKDIPQLDQFLHKITEEILFYIIENQCIHEEDDPVERYVRFLRQYPEIAKNISQKQLASYLHVSKATLCRIRAKAPYLVSNETKCQ